MNTNPKTQEYFEAQQLDANKKRQEFYQGLSEENKKKFDAVEQAVKILVDNKVLFYLYPFLPYVDNHQKNVVWQWNSVMELVVFDEKGFPTKEDIKKNQEFHNALFYQFYHLLIAGYSKETENMKFEEIYNLFIRKLYLSLNQYRDYMEEGTNGNNP